MLTPTITAAMPTMMPSMVRKERECSGEGREGDVDGDHGAAGSGELHAFCSGIETGQPDRGDGTVLNLSRSLRTSPSRMTITACNSGRCRVVVTITTVMPWSLLLKMPMISMLVRESRFPVGLSARSSLGWWTSPRAMAISLLLAAGELWVVYPRAASPTRASVLMARLVARVPKGGREIEHGKFDVFDGRRPCEQIEA